MKTPDEPAFNYIEGVPDTYIDTENVKILDALSALKIGDIVDVSILTGTPASRSSKLGVISSIDIIYPLLERTYSNESRPEVVVGFYVWERNRRFSESPEGITIYPNTLAISITMKYIGDIYNLGRISFTERLKYGYILKEIETLKGKLERK